MPRFLTLTDVAETLNVSMSQARAMVRSTAPSPGRNGERSWVRRPSEAARPA